MVRILAAVLVPTGLLACSAADPAVSDTAPETAAEEVVEPGPSSGDADVAAETAPDLDPDPAPVAEPGNAAADEDSEPESTAAEPEVAAAEEVSEPEVAAADEVLEDVADGEVEVEVDEEQPQPDPPQPDPPQPEPPQPDPPQPEPDPGPTCAEPLVLDCAGASPAAGSIVYDDAGIALSLAGVAIPPGSTVKWTVGGTVAGFAVFAPYEITATWASLGLAPAVAPAPLDIEVEVLTEEGCLGTCGYEVQFARRTACKFCQASEIWGTAAVLPSGDLVFATLNGKVYRVTPDCVPVWSTTFGSPISVGIVWDDESELLFFGSLDGKYYGMQEDGGVAWQIQIGSPGAMATVRDGVLYPSIFNKLLYAIQPSNGATIWTYSFPDYVSSRAAVASDGSVFVGCQDGSLYAAKEGGLVWSYATPSPIWGSPALAPDELSVYIGSNDGWVRKVTAAGELLWSTEVGAQVWGAIGLATNGDLVVPALPKLVTRLAAADGADLWTAKVGGLTYSSPVVSPEGYVYVGSSTGHVLAVDEADGAILFDAPTSPVPSTFHASVAISGDRVFLGSMNGCFYGLARHP